MKKILFDLILLGLPYLVRWAKKKWGSKTAKVLDALDEAETEIIKKD